MAIFYECTNSLIFNHDTLIFYTPLRRQSWLPEASIVNGEWRWIIGGVDDRSRCTWRRWIGSPVWSLPQLLLWSCDREVLWTGIAAANDRYVISCSFIFKMALCWWWIFNRKVKYDQGFNLSSLSWGCVLHWGCKFVCNSGNSYR